MAAPVNATDPDDVITLHDGKHLWIETQAAATTTDPDMLLWDKNIKITPIGTDSVNTTTGPGAATHADSTNMNPVLTTPPSFYDPREISGFRDPSVYVHSL